MSHITCPDGGANASVYKAMFKEAFFAVANIAAAQDTRYIVNRTQIPLRGLCAGYLKRQTET